MPALNEEGNIQQAINAVTSAAGELFVDYELIVVDDGSSDRTAAIAQDNARENGRIRLLSHPSPRGFGASYNTGRLAATKTHCIMVQGDSPFDAQQLRHFLRHAGEADVICGYIANPDFRGMHRQVISRIYTQLLNVLFRMRLQYFNGPQLHRTEWLRALDLSNHGYGFQAEVLMKALKSGKSFKEIPIRYTERPGGGVTKIFGLSNVVSVMRSLIVLWFWNLQFGGHAAERVE